MSYALEKWDRLISHTVHPDRRADFCSNPEAVEQLLVQSQSSHDKVRKQMIQQAFSFSKEKAKEMFVQQHQAVLIRLLDKVYQYKQCKGLDETTSKLYSTISIHLEAMLHFIEQYFSRYFSLEERVPISYLNLTKGELCQQLPACRIALQQRHDADEKLIALVCNYIYEFCSDGFLAYTYRDLIYHKELLKHISTLGTNGKVDHVYSALKEVLIYLNFNSPLFIDYFISQIHEELSLLSEKDSKIERLALHQKKIGQMHLKPGFALYSQFPSVRETLLEVLEREIEYLTTIKTKVLATPPGSMVEWPEKETVKDFIMVPFKVPEIYLLNKSFIDAGGAPTETYKSLLGKVGPYMANKNQRGFSPDSLQKGSDKVNPETKENVKRFLQRMIRNIDSYD